MHHSPDNSLLEGMNPADLLRQGMRPDTMGGHSRPSFQAPAIEELTPLFPELDLIEPIGEGGMGAVYKARQRGLDRLIALKILPEEIGGDAAFSEQFTREAKALAKLNHPNIVSIHEFGKKDDLYYIVMEYVDGTNLRTIMERGLINPKEALAIVPQICDALQYAHDRGIVHRDIKPENILLNRAGTVKVADFGLVKLVPAQRTSATGGIAQQENSNASVLTRDGKVMGTPAYMAPEQLETPSDVDHRADIYALGVVFYQMLTGELPGTRLSTPFRKNAIDAPLNDIVRKALESDPGKRYQQAGIMKTSLETLSATPPHPTYLNWRLTAGGLIGIAAGASLGIYASPAFIHKGTFATLIAAGAILLAASFLIHRAMKKSHENT
ncbi:serine/threonine protein kinase [Akkermansia glycaniphila]|uniref:serine/threonine-protein kinase n=1 Tax=Akkermansia glycaniphila TaxID=1679444 RepID=UPI001C010DB0|nr:serine/threonine-protein kinase [Akkermansia glycaniphila]MBT9449450.1 serine/threonine protein kinase [Akkermansia glycaniphila]